MALWVRKGKTTKQPLATALGSYDAFTRRRILAGVLLTAVVLTIFAVKSLSSGAVTVGLPSGIAFSRSHAQLEAGIVVKTGAKRLKLTAA